MAHRHHHHQPDRYEQQQIESDEVLAMRLQQEESRASGGQGRPVDPAYANQQRARPDYQSQGYQGQGYQGQGYQGQGYQGQGYQGQGYQGQGYQGQGYQNQGQQGHHQSQGYQSQGGYQSYQSQPPGQPQGFQGQPYQNQGFQGQPYQNSQAPGYQNQGRPGGPPQGYQGQPPPQGNPNAPQHQGYHYLGGPQPEFQGADQSQGQVHYPGGPPSQANHPYQKVPQPLRRKSLLIGINYTGSKQALRGCHQDVTNMAEFLSYKGYASDQRSQVIMRDDPKTDPRGPFYPTGKNMLAAMQWLVSEPNTCNFLHYSGHGSQVKDPDGDRDSGFDDTIVPIDFETNGQLDSDKLHRILVSALPASSTLFVIFDCCHSGSAIELPYVYRSDADGNVTMLDNVKTGMSLLHEAGSLLHGGFTMEKVGHARELFSGASAFFKQLQKSGEPQEEGVGEEHFVEDWKSEHKFVTMFSGCRDDQTSADARIGGSSVGAMSWAFLETMKRGQNLTYLSVWLQSFFALEYVRFYRANTHASIDTATDTVGSRAKQL